MTTEQYLMMCEQMGWEPEEDQMPKTADHLSHDIQVALLLYQILPDKVDSMGGLWLGKDFSGLGDIMEIYGVHKDIDIFELLLVAISETADFHEKRRKAEKK